jgi:predicted nucleic acid-binding protein
MRRFLSGLAASDIELESINTADIERVTEILAQYADARLDFTDAAIVALAERLNITYILTFDRRDFVIVHPQHCDFFELYP